MNKIPSSRVIANSSKKLKSNSTEKSYVKTVKITSYVFRAPEPYKTGIYIIIFSLLSKNSLT